MQFFPFYNIINYPDIYNIQINTCFILVLCPMFVLTIDLNLIRIRKYCNKIKVNLLICP